jgi:sarcosine oxidase subunit alpha
MTKRIVKGVSRSAPLHVTVDGVEVETFEGETLASVLLLAGNLKCYTTPGGRPRTMFCNMGTCFECRVMIESGGTRRWVLACNTPVKAGMRVSTGTIFPGPMAADPDD